MSHNSLLCLGDSYTIGEGVAIHESFPYHAVQQLRAGNVSFYAPEIIAKTGWTTFELKDRLTHTVLLNKYDFVTLLIGVNNQYRGLPENQYQADFEWLLHKAIALANNHPTHVIVLSIPDWSATPFASDHEQVIIAQQIDSFNRINEQISRAAQVHYVNIITGTRLAATDENILAADKLHYSSIENKRWANEVCGIITKELKESI